MLLQNSLGGPPKLEKQATLQHASSLEKHILAKMKNQQKVDESFFEYQKKLKFQSPLNRK